MPVLVVFLNRVATSNVWGGVANPAPHGKPLESIQRKGGSIAASSCAPQRGKRE